ncbi:MAG: cytochrome-c peroxidase [Thiotrichaceae bacterium]|nr:cytochrome-c peroxidase [Thiotrichaceae bacterium]
MQHSIRNVLILPILLVSGSLLANEPIQAIPSNSETNPALAELGKKLFFDPRLSKSGFISCNSCHNLSMGGTDNLKTSIGHHWQQGPINSPTVLNSTFNIAQFWDGRAKDLKEQAGGPIENPKEMASNHKLASKIIASIPAYREEFKQVFKSDTVNIDKITTAIAEFEKTLITPNSRFDQWLLGNKEAITAKEKSGYELFKTSGCIACHSGVAVGGNSYQKMGTIKPYITENKASGRFAVTGKESDKFVFKVPTLRNIELTYPYFHDGEASSLTEAVNTMAKIQLAKEFTKEETSEIVAFLKTLTGDQPDFKMPILPPSHESTPKPEPFDK